LKVVVHAVPELAGSRSAVITPSVGEAVIRGAPSTRHSYETSG
jgi:hypothetical protein